MNLQASSTINPIGNEPRELLTTEIIKYQLRNIKLPSTRRRNVQLERVSMATTFFFTRNIGRYRRNSSLEIKRTSPKGLVWIRFQGQFAERRVSRGICGRLCSLCARLKSNNERGKPWSRVGKVYTVFPWGVGLTDCQTLLAKG